MTPFLCYFSWNVSPWIPPIIMPFTCHLVQEVEYAPSIQILKNMMPEYLNSLKFNFSVWIDYKFDMIPKV